MTPSTSQPKPRTRILVVANETIEGVALRDEIAWRAAADDAELFLVCPALNGRLRHWFSDEDGARARAQERLDRSLSALADAGIEADGVVGDADPLQAIADGLAIFPADELVISTHPPARSNWLEKGVLRAGQVFGLPVTHVVVDLEGETVGGTPDLVAA
jgi:hypothetical protein